nr:MAG TPA: hypothetical protein [Caudoviricetes sp.]
MSGARATRTEQCGIAAAHTTAIPHDTPTRMNTTNPSPHTVHDHTLNDQRRSTNTIIVQ